LSRVESLQKKDHGVGGQKKEKGGKLSLFFEKKKTTV
jgi:hypothetical protein